MKSQRADGAYAHQRLAIAQLARRGIDARDVQRLGQGQARQNRGQRTRQLRLASVRRTRHETVVAAGAGNLQRPFGQLLPLDIHANQR